MKTLFGFLSAVCLSLSLSANAVTIDLMADQHLINLGDTIEMQVLISGLDGEKTLGVYDLDLHYDASLFSLINLFWGDAVKGNQLDLAGAGNLQDSLSGSGWLNLLEVSFDDAQDLIANQADEFTLFRIVFTSIAIGSGNFFVTNNVTGDAYGNNLIIDTISDSQVTVNNPVSVPEPSSLLMLLLGLLAVAALRAKLMRSSK